MRSRRPASGDGLLVQAWREVGWPLGVPAVLAGAWLLAMPVYLAAVFYSHALSHPDHFLYDYSFFRFAAERFARNPLALYAEPEYLYPPPAVLAFLPTTWLSQAVGYVLSGPLIFGGLALAYAWALRLWDEDRGPRTTDHEEARQETTPPLGEVAAKRTEGVTSSSSTGRRHEEAPPNEEAASSVVRGPSSVVSTPTRLALLVVALGSGPTFQNLKYAQVNVLVLLSALAFLHLVRCGRPGWGALALTGGFWLKLLPLALLPLGCARRWPRLALGTVAGLLLVPALLLPIVPLELYREYALGRLPAISGMTDLGALSNSVQASLTRLGSPIEVIIRGGMVEASPLARVVGALVGAGVLAAATLGAWTRRLPLVRTGFVVLAVLPVAVPLGWEHTYVLALPLLLVALAEVRDRPLLVQALVTLAALAFFAQRLPPPQTALLVDALPRALIDLYAARLWLATLGLIALGLWPAVRTLGPPPPARP